jgi:hypothetical protein
MGVWFDGKPVRPAYWRHPIATDDFGERKSDNKMRQAK